MSCLREDEAKTSGPAIALADNANAANDERRFHKRLIAPLGVAVKPRSGNKFSKTPGRRGSVTFY
ncbi:hypothetical protein DY251_03255 [Mesorhizobium denitrificans]|uniref:Uncharacterized protein n=1 Tax=Mesorhizobium denitrificans TaxID=2294114 RepID=A0A371XIS3_9HYPH|nr:hypothetical protein DY251_03255 [Mesorhizobium denitrificans]